jgi:hypothetical protein
MGGHIPEIRGLEGSWEAPYLGNIYPTHGRYPQ